MMDEGKPSLSMNWVARRAHREQMLQDGAEEVWESIRSAIQDACETFNKHYAKYSPNSDVKCDPENSHRLNIVRLVPKHGFPQQSERLTVLVLFDHASLTVKATSDKTLTFTIEADDEGVFASGSSGVRLEPDEISQQILEPMLFHGAPKPRPATRRQSSDQSWMA